MRKKPMHQKRKWRKIENLENKESECSELKLTSPIQNHVVLTGKVSKTHGLKYTPAGEAICEFTLAVPQRYYEKNNIGYFEIVLMGQAAEDSSAQLKIGKTLFLTGTLWTRTYTNRQGNKVNETKIVIENLGPDRPTGRKNEKVRR